MIYFDTIKALKTVSVCHAMLFFFIFNTPSYGQNDTRLIPSPKSYIAYRTTETITIDGLAKEKSWKKAKPTASFIDIEGTKIPKYKTTVKIVWDNENIYFLAEMQEPHVWGYLKQRDTIVFHNNDFEIFIDPDNDTHNYYEFEINALNTLWDLFLTKPYREGTPVLNDWDANGFQSAVKVHGTLNNPDDTDNGWHIEIAIPFKVFKTSYYHQNIPADSFWRVNFSRVNWDFQLINKKYYRKKDRQGNIQPEYNWVWSPTGVINMHEPEHWGYVYFSSKLIGAKDKFKVPEDEKVKQFLYHLYRSQKAYFKKHKRWIIDLTTLSKTSFTIEEHKVTPTLEHHQTGWNIAVKSPFTNHLFIIKEDGRIIKKEE